MRKLEIPLLAAIFLFGGVCLYTQQNRGGFSFLAQISSGGTTSPIVTFTANPASISYNATSTLFWELKNVKSCTALPPTGSSVSWYPGGTISLNSSGYTFVNKWGSSGAGNGQFNGPGHMARDTFGNVYVSDYGNYRIQKFSSSGMHLSTVGSYGSGNGQFLSPYGVVLDASGNIYVVDGSNQRIQKFNSSGTYLLQWGSPGSGNGQFRDPYGIAVDASGNVYVTESSGHRIQKFDSFGNFIAKWGSQGSGNAQFQNPKGITVDVLGNVYVVDQGNNRIQKFNSFGTYLSQWGSPGSGNGQFNSARSIVTDALGNIYVADGSNNRIQKFNSSGTYLSQWGSPGSGNRQFNLTEGIVVDASGNVYVSDYGNNRIQVFAFSSATTNGSRVIGPLMTTTTYSLRCTGLDNTIITKSVTINVQTPPSPVVVTPNTSGFAWSENIGWISFRNSNQGSNYGVRIDPTNGNLSGYAWSEHIGWIDFNQTIGCLKGACQPKLNLSGVDKNKTIGWGKALTGDAVKGWDGWISLSSKNSTSGPVYGVIRKACTLQGYAWGSDVVGWISFSSENCDPDKDGKSNGVGYCPAAGTTIPAYGVKLENEACENNPPAVTIGCTPSTCLGYTNSPGLLNFNLSMTDQDNNLATCKVIIDGVDKGGIPCNTTLLNASQYGVGSHTIQIVVTDTEGLSATSLPVSFTIRQDIQPSFDCSLDGINFKACGQLKIFSGTKVYFRDTSIPSTGGTITTRNWQFAGGAPATASGSIVSTRFTTEGSKNIVLTVSEASGNNGRTGNSLLVITIVKNLDFKEIAPE